METFTREDLKEYYTIESNEAEMTTYITMDEP
jgi:hypothetical protein